MTTWNIQNMLNELKELEKRFVSSNDEYEKMLLALSRQTYVEMLDYKGYDTNVFKLSRWEENKYKKNFKKDFKDTKYNLKEIINTNYDDFANLIYNNSINKISNIKIDKSSLNKKMSVKCIKQFTKQFDIKLYNHFNYLYKNGYVEFSNYKNRYYNGACHSINCNNKGYLVIYKCDAVAPVLLHETSHSYEYLIDRKDKAWQYNVSLFSEVFAILMTLIFDDYLLNTECLQQSLVDRDDFLKTNIYLAKELNKLEKFNQINDFMYLLNSNIAVAFLNQYNDSVKEAKRNINYFINNNDVCFSNDLLRSVDIDLDKLYKGEYFKEYNQKCKKLIK